MGIVAPIMIARMQVCVQKGFDGVQFDNVQDWDNPTGIDITREESAYYTAWMANKAHEMGLSAAWENAPPNVAVLEPYMEALIFESCSRHQFCGQTAPMINAGKWAGGVEYNPAYKDMSFCPTYAQYHMMGAFRDKSLLSPIALPAMRQNKAAEPQHGVKECCPFWGNLFCIRSRDVGLWRRGGVSQNLGASS